MIEQPRQHEGMLAGEQIPSEIELKTHAEGVIFQG